MKLQFRHQLFQADAAKTICDVFAGQPFQTVRLDGEIVPLLHQFWEASNDLGS